MSFYPLLDKLTTIPDEEINVRLSELNAKMVRAHQLGMGHAVIEQMQVMSDTLREEQGRRAFVKSQEQNNNQSDRFMSDNS